MLTLKYLMDVYFFIDMALGVDGDIIKSELEKLADDISIDVMRYDELNLNWGFGRTSKATYELLFNAQLEYRADAVPSIYGSSSGYIETIAFHSSSDEWQSGRLLCSKIAGHGMLSIKNRLLFSSQSASHVADLRPAVFDTKPAQIPAQFHGKIKCIELDLEAYAVD